jgi:hypothetical protein
MLLATARAPRKKKADPRDMGTTMHMNISGHRYAKTARAAAAGDFCMARDIWPSVVVAVRAARAACFGAPVSTTGSTAAVPERRSVSRVAASWQTIPGRKDMVPSIGIGNQMD